jgi:uncharacterized membrane protein
MRARSAVVALAALALLALALPTADAADPRPPDWEQTEVPGGPADVGLLAGGTMAVGTDDADALPGTGAGCQDPETELLLVDLEADTACSEAVDVDGEQSQRDGLVAMATGERGPTVYAAPRPTDVGGGGADLVAYDVEEGNLTTAFTKTVTGFVPILDASQRGHRVAAVVQSSADADSATFTLRAYADDGTRLQRHTSLDEVLAMDLSANGRYAAVGGTTTRGGEDVGYVQLYDLREASNQNPVAEPVFEDERARSVESVAVTDAGRILAGTFEGAVATMTASEDPSLEPVGSGTAHVTATRSGNTLAAASGDELVRLTASEGDLDTRWNRTLNGTSTDAVARGLYIAALADETHGFQRDGTELWTVTGGDVLAANRTGLQLGLAEAGTRTGASGNQQDTSVVTAREVHRNLTIEQSVDPPSATPGNPVSLNVTLANTGAAVLRGSPTVDGRSPFRLDVRPANLTLLPGETRNVTATLEVPEDARPGPRDVPVRFASTPFVDATGTLTVDVGPTIDLSLRLDPGTLAERAVLQGQETTVRLTLENQGNTDADARVRIQQVPDRGGDWPVQASPTGNVTVAAGTVSSVAVDVTVPEDAANGTTNRIVTQARTSEGVAATAVTFTVNPFEALEVRPDTQTKRMAPGTTSSYEFEVANLGSVTANVTLDATPVDETGDPFVSAAWGVALDRSRVVVEPGDTVPAGLDLTAPANATQNGSLRVQITATSDEARASAVAFGVADPGLASEDGDEPQRQPLGLLAGLASLSLAALLRRSHDGKV